MLGKHRSRATDSSQELPKLFESFGSCEGVLEPIRVLVSLAIAGGHSAITGFRENNTASLRGARELLRLSRWLSKLKTQAADFRFLVEPTRRELKTLKDF